VAAAVLVLTEAVSAVIRAVDAAALARIRAVLDARSLTCRNPADVAAA